MAKLYQIKDWVPGLPDWYFYCPGCKCDHGVWTSQPDHPRWDFNGDINKPTFSPSIKVTWPSPKRDQVCHTFIRDGKIEFLGDCTHELAGKTVDMEEVKD